MPRAVIFQHFSCLPEMIFPFFLVKLDQSFQLFLCGVFFCVCCICLWGSLMHIASNEATKEQKKGTPEKWEMFRWLLMSRLILPFILLIRYFMFWLLGFQPEIGVFTDSYSLLWIRDGNWGEYLKSTKGKMIIPSGSWISSYCKANED